jgi:Fe2+ transport system protein FeoA
MKSDPRAQDQSLATLRPGRSAEVVALPEARAHLLLGYGLHAGVTVTVEADAPFGGPRIVRSGAARLAVARRLAGDISVRELTGQRR